MYCTVHLMSCRHGRPRAGALLVAATIAVVCSSCGAQRLLPGSQPSTGALANGFTVPAAAPGHNTWAPWPSALHDARHSGASNTDGPTSGALRWQRHLEGAITPGPVVGPDGTIYIASNGGVLHALSPSSGQDLWTFDSGVSGGGDLSVSPLVLPDGTILWPTAGRQLIALSARGEMLWSLAMPGHPTSPASVDGHRVYVGDDSGAVTAVDVEPGQAPSRVWTVTAGAVSYGSVVVATGGRLYTTADSALVAIDDSGPTATVAWRKDPGDAITEVSAGVAADGTALLGTNGNREWAYRPDGTPLWNSPRIITYSSPSVTDSGLVYVGDHSGTVHVFGVGDGAQVASYKSSGDEIWSSTIVDARYRVYYGTQSGHAVGFDPGGAQLFDVDLGAPIDSYPALTADNALIVGARNGTLSAIG